MSPPSTRCFHLVAVLAASGVSARAGAGQERPAAGQAPSLPARLAPATKQVIERLADSLHAAGLPVDPLYAKAAEGVLKNADDARILVAVRTLARELGEARSAVGATADPGALSAAAAAIHAGLPVATLQRLARLSGGAPDSAAELATALITLADLVKNQVDASAAATAVEDLLSHRAPLDHYTVLRIDIEEDIRSGRSPDEATRTRTESIVRALGGRGPPGVPLL